MDNQGRERIQLIDALRGVGVFGILTVNASLMAASFRQFFDPTAWPYPNTGLSLGLWEFVRIFCESKFITLFSLLFGVSMYLVGGEPGSGRDLNLVRRFGWMVVFGLIHGTLIWYGDVLLDYALCGFAIMACRGWSGRSLLIFGSFAFVAGALFMSGVQWLGGVHPEIFNILMPGKGGTIAGFQGSFAQSLGANFHTWAHYRIFIAVFTLPYSAPLMLIGLGLFKTGFLTGERGVGLYIAATIVGVLSLAAEATMVLAQVHSGFSDDGPLWQALAVNFTSSLAALGYASALILGAKSGILRWLVKLLAPMGRMAFTNYIGQSILMTIVFYGGRGPGLFDHLDRPAIALVVVGIWTIELIWSHLWLRVFDAGPLEWLWRCLTYGRLGPILKAKAQPV